MPSGPTPAPPRQYEGNPGGGYDMVPSGPMSTSQWMDETAARCPPDRRTGVAALSRSVQCAWCTVASGPAPTYQSWAKRPGFIAQGALRADANEARKKEPNRSVDRNHAPQDPPPQLAPLRLRARQDPPPQLAPLRLRARQGWALGEGGCEWAAETHWTLNTPRVFGSSARLEKTRAW